MRRPYADVVLAGAYNTEQARHLPGHDSESITVAAACGVLDRTGADTDSVDGVFGSFCGEIAYALGLSGVSSCGVENYGIAAVLEAAQAIACGMCTTAIVANGGAGLYVDRDATAPWTRPANEWVVPYGLFTAAEFALIAQRHMAQYGTTPEQLATVSASIRNNGHINPHAVYYGRGPFDIDTILDSRMIAEPFHLLDCAMTSEGGCAVLLTTPDRAADLRLPAVRILGGATDRMGPQYQHPPTWDLRPGRGGGIPNGYIGRRAARIAFGTAGLRPADIDVCEFYDPFSFEIIRQFEAFEFCEEGQGGAFVSDGRIGLDGSFPTTTDGGLMSYSHAGFPQMLQRVARGLEQLQGRCRSGQIDGAATAMCSNGGAAALFTDVLILGRE